MLQEVQSKGTWIWNWVVMLEIQGGNDCMRATMKALVHLQSRTAHHHPLHWHSTDWKFSTVTRKECECECVCVWERFHSAVLSHQHVKFAAELQQAKNGNKDGREQRREQHRWKWGPEEEEEKCQQANEKCREATWNKHQGCLRVRRRWRMRERIRV